MLKLNNKSLQALMNFKIFKRADSFEIINETTIELIHGINKNNKVWKSTFIITSNEKGDLLKIEDFDCFGLNAVWCFDVQDDFVEVQQFSPNGKFCTSFKF